MMRKIPWICTRNASFDAVDAGWYVPNSVNLRDIAPDWRRAGGGVTKDKLTSLDEALRIAISYTKSHISSAEKHLKKLEAALDEVTNEQ